MVKIESLRPQFSEASSLQMQADGYSLWMNWAGASLNPVVTQTLEDYGGVDCAEDSEQSLWFFFTSDIFLAAARLAGWARFNQLALTMQVFPVRFKVGRAGEKLLIFDEALWRQELSPPTEFQIWAHPGVARTVEGIPGLSLEQKPVPAGMSATGWMSMAADSRLPYQSSMGWFAILHPVGNPLDKGFQTGWREFFSHIEDVLQRNKFRFTVNNFFLMFPLEGLHNFRNWCRDFLTLVARVKEEKPEQYWPCVLAIIDRKGHTFNDDLPRKIGLDWEQLAPDYPCMSIRNALMLGGEFTFYDVRFAQGRQAPEDWSTITLCSAGDDSRDLLPHLVPGSLVFGDFPPCFYCGHRGHAPADCPTRVMEPHAPALWRQVALLDSTDMADAVRHIDEILVTGEQSAFDACLRDDSPAGIMLRAFYDLDWVTQLRNASFFWRARDKDFKKARATLVAEDNSPIWGALHDFQAKRQENAEKDLYTLSVRFPKDARVTSLRGFVALEAGDVDKALSFWKEAEVFSQPVAQAWHVYLQARAYEIQGRLSQALLTYEQALRLCPSWIMVEYRRLVCQVKSGFAEQSLPALIALLDRDGSFFNRMLIDPELERGHLQILSMLQRQWILLAATAKEEAQRLERIREDLGAWFLPENEFAGKTAERIDSLLQLASIKNYVTFQTLVRGRMQVEKDVLSHVQQESRSLKNQFSTLGARLHKIHEDAAWFPFPRALADFNKNYNQSVANINWASAASFHLPEAFRKAQALAEQEKERLNGLEKRMRFLRIVRDSTLFVLSMGESFFWMELCGIILIFLLLPLILVYGDKLGFDATAELISRQRWQVQKALFFIVSVLAMGVAGLRTVLRFERIRDKILAKAKETGMQPETSDGKKKSKKRAAR